MSKLKTQLAEKRRDAVRKESLDMAKENGLYIADDQLFSRRKPEYALQVYPAGSDPEQVKADALAVLESLHRALDIDNKVIEDWKDGVTDIMYLDSELNGHIIPLTDDLDFFYAAAEIRRITGATPFLGLKWDNQHSPVFACMTDAPEMLGVNKYNAPIMSSGSETAGIMCSIDFRYCRLGLYFWVNDVLCDDYVEIDCHDGVLYPVVAFPGLQEKDGIEADDIVMI